MKRILVLFTWVALALSIRAGENLMFPQSTITVHGPLGYKESVPVLVDPALLRGIVQSVSNAQGTFASRKEIDGKTQGGELSWRHIARTEFGDVYLVHYLDEAGHKHAGVLLFDGHVPANWRSGDWSVTISKSDGSG